MAPMPPLPEPLWKTASPEVQAAVLALVEYYEQRLAQLESRVKDLENRLKLNSTNSSKPPSSDPIGLKRKPPSPPSKKTRGGQPGHPKAHRALVPPEKVRDTINLDLTIGSIRGSAAPAGGRPVRHPKRHQKKKKK